MKLPEISGVAKMEFFGSKLFTIILVSLIGIAPLILWVILWTIDKSSSLNPSAVLPWIRVLRWITWCSAIVLFLAGLFGDHFQHFPRYAGAMLTFSIGLSLPQSWLKKKILPSV
jgi:hypothetical protein